MILVLMTVLIGIALLIASVGLVLKKTESIIAVFLTGFAMVALMLISLSLVVNAVVEGQIPL